MQAYKRISQLFIIPCQAGLGTRIPLVHIRDGDRLAGHVVDLLGPLRRGASHCVRGEKRSGMRVTKSWVGSKWTRSILSLNMGSCRRRAASLLSAYTQAI